MTTKTYPRSETPIKNGMVIHSLAQSMSHGLANIQNVLPLLKRVMEEGMAYDFVVKSTQEHVCFSTVLDFAEAESPRGLQTCSHTLREQIDIFTFIDAAAILTPGYMSEDEIEELKDWIRHG